MATNLALDDKLIEEARQLGGQRTKKDVVTQALQEYVQRRKQLKLLECFGAVEYDDDYDYKTQRSVARTSAPV
ncbi:MAG: type II toxin-antitoxin system VapB family antitoxin [Hydrogenophaga sp.]|uniref:type II toxin-antitoxin system VapB family antitoxin n=1 Tax=Hydrogenophaga sp. TaxID=1904254 RepID=UPI00271C560F|nr:type II toxin-antitoxin system VapB family antitoxin [Hydrogenophaga sp.]MDO9480926.1 type II toxin-antitoxin system VapB family antitoxin [Hydrogenophaga sp.]MDP1895992.1 type II toxin-antitoxin system VapB family antitoxin [Hydrogenophaga sp.]MDP3344271.1 type II toxin-antitoxin system VapB family antitoxin [Hydrogenophaga sp.]MDP3808906.1 type II toxin-antitoxin system VapB family antitoxin [Hydrogenophaga sp.]MDP3926591.1 type II toxin-antitoxin system VapB family antitoxin [Hydrogenoph